MAKNAADAKMGMKKKNTILSVVSTAFFCGSWTDCYFSCL